MTLSKNIETIRKYLRMNQQEFGDLFGVGRTAVSKWENGENEPPISVLVALDKMVGIGLSRMVEGELTIEDLDKNVLNEPVEKGDYTKQAISNAELLEAVTALRMALELEREAASADRAENSRLRKDFDFLKKRVEMLDSEILRLASKKK
jgi:transcriptional regulator with XRE-family HTH domain